MNKPILLSFVPALLLSSLLHGFAPAREMPELSQSLEPFPEAEPGMTRFVFQVPPLENEDSALVTLIVGKVIETDGINQYSLGGSLKKHNVPGWGYSYYKADASGHAISTLMAAPPDTEPVMRFVEMRHDLGPISYNSKLPIVLIVPEGFEVRYRIWAAGPVETAPEG